MDIVNCIGSLITPTSGNPLEIDGSSVTYSKGERLGLFNTATKTIKVHIGQSSYHNSRFGIGHLDFVAVPAVAVAVGKDESEFALVFRET